eukprot:TRINITY_DN6272_c0_g1_i1.p2 TRINITY_DN6272_c0_g1~~TRINITY_DN6272_c0_g1_i1.p2  ORF type:complete len:314 (-),score=61.28 TRINITY_DN6272_c0_g1_i1:926-1867(-)
MSQFLGMLIYIAGETMPIKPATKTLFQMPTVTVPLLLTLKSRPVLSSTITESGGAGGPLNFAGVKLASAGVISLKGTYSKVYSRGHTRFFDSASYNGCPIGIGLLKVAEDDAAFKRLKSERKLTAFALANQMVHVLVNNRYFCVVDELDARGVVQAMPKAQMLDEVQGADAAVMLEVFFRDLPHLLTEFRAQKWLFVDTKPNNLAITADLQNLVAVDLDSVVLYTNEDNIPQPHLHDAKFSAPEIKLHKSTTLKSDVFAFGQLMNTMISKLNSTAFKLAAAQVAAQAIVVDVASRIDMATFIQLLHGLPVFQP